METSSMEKLTSFETMWCENNMKTSYFNFNESIIWVELIFYSM